MKVVRSCLLADLADHFLEGADQLLEGADQPLEGMVHVTFLLKAEHCWSYHWFVDSVLSGRLQLVQLGSLITLLSNGYIPVFQKAAVRFSGVSDLR